jgi:hypothetical protein
MSWRGCGYLCGFVFIAEAPHHHRVIRTLFAVRPERRSCSLSNQNRFEQSLDWDQPNRSGKGWRARGIYPAICEIR